MKPIPTLKNEFILLCTEEYKGNKSQLKIIREFDQDYSPDRALWWYTRDSFLYRLINRALRVQNIDLLFLLQFVIRDLKQQLEQYQCSSCIQLYRGQLISNDELQLLKDSIGQLISINSFLSTSLDRELAISFVNSSTPLDDLERVLFEIVADSRLKGIKPFANITSFSNFPREEEVLIMLGSIFRLVDIRQDNDRVWIIQMTLCSDCDSDLKSVFEQMKKDHSEIDAETNLLSFGNILLEMGKYDLAEKYFYRLLNELSEDHEVVARCYYALGNLATKKDNLDSSLEWHYKSLEIKIQKLRSDDPELADSYNSIGIVHRKKDDRELSIKSFRKALTIFQQAYGDEHPKVAQCLNNMGYVYLRMKKYSAAMDHFQKALSIDEKYFSAYHPYIGVLHNSIADTYRGLHNYDEALKHVTLSLTIFQKSLPPQHYQNAWAFEIIGNVYEEKKELAEALSHYRKAAGIYCNALPATHYYVVGIKRSIERLSSQMNS